MTDKPAVLIMQRHLGALTPFLESAYTVYRFWEGPPAEAAHAIRAVIVAGEYPVDKALLETLPDVGLIACFTSGYNGIDTGWARGHGLQMSHAPGVNHEDVADHALGLILGSRRALVSGDRQLRAGEWSGGAKPMTRSMRGQTIGIAGLGQIGLSLAERLEPLGVQIRWWGPNPKPDITWPRDLELIDLAKASDVLVVAAKATEENRGLISREIIDALGPDGLLVNVSRGLMVDEDALIVALKDGRLGAAALDVFEEEPTPAERWTDVPNTFLTPHTAGAGSASLHGMLGLLLANLEAYFAGQPLKTPILD
jgi:lactate dehydrogenase-like 2-hydroxyacid dehydrogenase